MKEFLEKLRALPESQKKVIFFAVIIIAALIIGFFQIRATVKNVSKIQQSIGEIKFPEFIPPDFSTVTEGNQNIISNE